MRFKKYYGNHIESITKDRLGEERANMRYVEGMYDDTDGFGDNVQIIKKAIIGDVMNEVVLPDKTVQKMDLALEKIMKDGNGKTKQRKSKKGQQQAKVDNDEDTGGYDDDDDGNDWED